MRMISNLPNTHCPKDFCYVRFARKTAIRYFLLSFVKNLRDSFFKIPIRFKPVSYVCARLCKLAVIQAKAPIFVGIVNQMTHGWGIFVPKVSTD